MCDKLDENTISTSFYFNAQIKNNSDSVCVFLQLKDNIAVAVYKTNSKNRSDNEAYCPFLTFSLSFQISVC